MAERSKGRAKQLVGPGLDPVDLARRMLDLGVSSFECGSIKVTFAESAVHEAALRRAPVPEPLDADTAKRLKTEAEAEAKTKALEAELWSVQ